MTKFELIDKNALICKFCNECQHCKRIEEMDGDPTMCKTVMMIAEMPTIEAEPVRHGRWNYRHEDDWCYCTACGTDAEGSYGECLETDYCPHCGAKMDGGAENG